VPRIFRAMLKDGDLPMVGTQARMLGPAPKDIEADAAGAVHAGRDGISVAPSLRLLPSHHIPKRLRQLAPDATGSNTSVIWRHGEGAFADRATVAPHLELRVDTSEHGVVAPDSTMSLTDYQLALAITRTNWVEDERG
jgi:hypothetical protein